MPSYWFVLLSMVLASFMVGEVVAQVAPRSPNTNGPKRIGAGARPATGPRRIGAGQPPNGPRRLSAKVAEKGPTEAPAKAAENAQLGDHVVFASLGVKLRLPSGFAQDKTFDGFSLPEKKASVMILSLPGPFAQIAQGFTAENMKPRGLTLLGKTEQKVGNLPGMLVQFDQSAGGIDFRKWALLYGTDAKTTFITATFPVSEEAQFSEQLKACLLSATAADDPAAAEDATLPFTLAMPTKLKRVAGVSRTLVFNKQGKLPNPSPADPLFIAAPSLGTGNYPGTKETAERRLHQMAQIKNVKITSTKPVTIGGIDGFESLAAAEDKESGDPLAIYQVMVFHEGGYFLLVGLIGSQHGEEYLPEFKTLAHSLKLKSK